MHFFSSSLKISGGGINICDYTDDKITKINENNDLNSLGYAILSKDKQFLYALCEKDGFEGVGKYKTTEDELQFVEFFKTTDCGLCHLTLSPCEKFIYAANYHNGSMSVIDKTGEIQLFKYGPVSRVHMVTFRPSLSELFSVDLGCNVIRVYDRNLYTGKLSLKETINTQEGNGPRHIVFLNENVFYVVFELSNQISVYKNQNNRWECIQTVSTLPENCNTQSAAAAIKIYNNILYSSNRGHNSIITYDIQSDFTLQQKNIYPLDYDFPRDFLIIDEQHIAVAFQKSNKIVLYKMDDGLLELSSIDNLDGVIGLC